MLGSIRRFGNADVSQCETDDPLDSVVGAYMSARCAVSAPW